MHAFCFVFSCQRIPEYHEVEAQCADDRLLWHRYTKRMVAFIRGIRHLAESKASQNEEDLGSDVALRAWVLSEIHNGMALQRETSKQ